MSRSRFFPFVHPSASISDLAVRYFELPDYYEGKAGDDAALLYRRSMKKRTSW
ncbi:MAG: hypothetical protein V8S30_00240 [Merdibacter sp.]